MKNRINLLMVKVLNLTCESGRRISKLLGFTAMKLVFN